MYSHNKAQQSKNRVHISWDILYRGLTGLPASERFSGLFCTCFEISISIWNMVYTLSRKCHTSSHITIRSLWPTYSQKWVTVIFLHIWPQQWYRALGFGTHIYITSVLTRFFISVIVGPYLALWWPQTLGRGISAELSASENILSTRLTRMGFLWPTSCS